MLPGLPVVDDDILRTALGIERDLIKKPKQEGTGALREDRSWQPHP